MIVPGRMTRATVATARSDGATADPSRMDEPLRHGLLERGRNCDTIRHADRFAMLVDGDAYFATLRTALLRARHTVFIVGWDVDSRMHLPPADPGDGLPDTLAAFLHALASSRHNLRIYVLAWDFAMIYALERDWPPVYRAAWRAHRGIRFRLDDTHPRGASHHQKLVVIDDRLAFVGGLDLTRARWDTPAHAADDPRRRDAHGMPYGPFHDVQAMFDGDAAAAIGKQARARWFNACGRPIAIRAQRHLDLLSSIRDLTERPTMAFSEIAPGQHFLDFRGELQKRQSPADRRFLFPHPRGDRILGKVVGRFGQLLESARFFQGVEIFALEVFDQADHGCVLVIFFLKYEGVDGFPAQQLGRAQAAFARD